jgi:hypothetical protein
MLFSSTDSLRSSAILRWNAQRRTMYSETVSSHLSAVFLAHSLHHLIQETPGQILAPSYWRWIQFMDDGSIPTTPLQLRTSAKHLTMSFFLCMGACPQTPSPRCARRLGSQVLLLIDQFEMDGLHGSGPRRASGASPRPRAR